MPILLSFPRPLSITDFSPATSTSASLMNPFYHHSSISFLKKKKKSSLTPHLSSATTLFFLYCCSWSSFSKGLLVIFHFLCNHSFYKKLLKKMWGTMQWTLEFPTNHPRKFSIANIVEDSWEPFFPGSHLLGSFPLQEVATILILVLIIDINFFILLLSMYH